MYWFVTLSTWQTDKVGRENKGKRVPEVAWFSLVDKGFDHWHHMILNSQNIELADGGSSGSFS